jgi:bla regulator protein BlaR1
MTMLFLQGLLNDKLINALCWTLLHSLWQGLLFSIITAFTLLMTRRSKPALRYNIFTALLLLFIATAGITFMREIFITKGNSPVPVKLLSTALPSAGAGPTLDTEVLSTTMAPTYFDSVLRYLNVHASLIVAIWFVLFSIKLLKMIVNIRYMRYISHRKTFEPAFFWKQRITELAKTLRLQRPVVLLESAIIKVPLVVGMIKPVILIPVGLLSNFPPAQIEAALLHELAHIRRNDYLVNLLQSFTEIAFFFNPAVHWLSSLMREERENCCDDIAIGCIKNKKQFIHALVAFQEYIMLESNKSIAIAFAGQKKYLLNRVRRIIYNENKKLNAMEKGILILSIVVTSLIGFATIKQTSVDGPLSPAHSSGTMTLADTIPVTQSSGETDSIPRLMEFKSINSVSNKEGDFTNRIITAVDKNGKKYKLVEKNDELVELYVDDKKIPRGELSNYENIIKHIAEEIELREKAMQGKLKRDQAEQGQKITELDAERLELLQKLSELDQERARLGHAKENQLWDHEWENAANGKYFDLLLNLKQDNQALLDTLKNPELSALFYDKLASLNKMNADNLFQQKLFNENLNDTNDNYLDKLLHLNFDQQHQTELLNEKLGLLTNSALEQQQYHTYVLIDPIIQDMVEQKIIPEHQEELSFELNNNSFLVNGKKQPAETHERFRKKYLKKNGDYFKFSRKNGSTSTSIKLDCDKPE